MVREEPTSLCGSALIICYAKKAMSVVNCTFYLSVDADLRLSRAVCWCSPSKDEVLVFDWKGENLNNKSLTLQI